MIATALLLAGCAGGPPPRPATDGPEASPPLELDRVPDAVPQVEPLRVGGPNRPYQIFGVSYVPITTDRPFKERGLASWYGRKFHGQPTASGEIYNMYAMTAAHPTLPIPSYVRVRNPSNGREAIVRVNDRGPFHRGRIIDLSYTAALKLGLLRGLGIVEIERLTHDEIRAGTWRRDAVAAAPPIDVVREPERAATPAAQGYWVQLGAFRQRDGAVELQRRVAREQETLAPLLAIFEERAMHRLQAGPFVSRDQALDVAERVRSALRLVPVIVERR
jgi:rare lipoprotein A